MWTQYAIKDKHVLFVKIIPTCFEGQGGIKSLEVFFGCYVYIPQHVSLTKN